MFKVWQALSARHRILGTKQQLQTQQTLLKPLHTKVSPMNLLQHMI